MNKRFLTREEIEDIIEFNQPQKGIPIKTANSIVEANKNFYRKELAKQFVNPQIIPELKRDIEKYHQKSLIEYGCNVGVICAQSVGEKQTQATLNVFHFTGSSEKINTTSIARIIELLSATKTQKNKNCTMIFKNNNKTLNELRKIINYSVVDVKFGDLVQEYQINTQKQQPSWYSLYEQIYETSVPEPTMFLDCSINISLLVEYRITLSQICRKITNEYPDLICIPSPDSISKIHIYNTIDYSFDSSDIRFLNPDNAPYIHYTEVVYKNIENISICGIPGIKNIFVEQDTNKTWKIETDGTNLQAILAHPYIDAYNTISNDIWEIYNVLGIEAVRTYMIKEFIRVIGDINVCHIKLLVDKMTFTGSIKSISRYSTKTEDLGPMTAASFEESLEKFTKASIFSQVEKTNGVSASIMCGKMTQTGTGSFSLLVDIDKLL